MMMTDEPRGSSGLTFFIQSPVDLGNFVHPALALTVFQRQHLFVRPVKMKRDIRYLLVEPL
jgi:hypothetical protein